MSLKPLILFIWSSQQKENAGVKTGACWAGWLAGWLRRWKSVRAVLCARGHQPRLAMLCRAIFGGFLSDHFFVEHARTGAPQRPHPTQPGATSGKTHLRDLSYVNNSTEMACFLEYLLLAQTCLFKSLIVFVRLGQALLPKQPQCQGAFCSLWNP